MEKHSLDLLPPAQSTPVSLPWLRIGQINCVHSDVIASASAGVLAINERGITATGSGERRRLCVSSGSQVPDFFRASHGGRYGHHDTPRYHRSAACSWWRLVRARTLV